MSAREPQNFVLDDPLCFVLHALEAEGALVDRAADRATALLPPALATRLALADELELALYPDREGDTAAGLGTPLLEKLVGEACRTVPAASAHLRIDPPRPAHARSIAARFGLRNGPTEILRVSHGAGHYLAVSVAYVIEADDRREGLLAIAAASDGGEPDSALFGVLDVRSLDLFLPGRIALSAERASRWAVIRAARAVAQAAAPVLNEIERRHERDRARIAEYFAALAREARAPRRRTDPAAIEAKIAHLAAERDKKIEDLRTRYAARVTASVAAVVVAEVPAALVQVRLRRRKAERTIILRVPAGVYAADKPACDGCGMPADKPAACDDALHLLCEACAPNAQGRIACPACRAD